MTSESNLIQSDSVCPNIAWFIASCAAGNDQCIRQALFGDFDDNWITACGHKDPLHVCSPLCVHEVPVRHCAPTQGERASELNISSASCTHAHATAFMIAAFKIPHYLFCRAEISVAHQRPTFSSALRLMRKQAPPSGWPSSQDRQASKGWQGIGEESDSRDSVSAEILWRCSTFLLWTGGGKMPTHKCGDWRMKVVNHGCLIDRRYVR